jgi:two-component system LytT family response regulator
MMKRMRALIIDDVANARELLWADLKAHCPEIDVVGEADGVVEGAKQIRALQPDLVFLDVQMPDGSGFDLLDIIGDIHFHIIFTTASDAHAIKALRLSAIDYLLKPLDTDELREAVQKALKAEKSALGVEALKENLQAQQPARIVLNSMEKIQIESIGDIASCEGSAGYTIIHFIDGRQLLVTRTLKEFDHLLQEHGFMRVHQSHVVNFACVKAFLRADGGFLQLSTGSEVPVSSRKRAQVVTHLQNLGIHS